MKRYLILFVTLFSIIGCADSELVTPGDEFVIPVDPPVISTGTFRFKFDGEWVELDQAVQAAQSSFYDPDTDTYSYISQIAGANVNFETGQIGFFSAIEPGTITTENYNLLFSYTKNINSLTEVVSYTNIGPDDLSDFTVTILEYDDANLTVSGIFEGTVYDSEEVIDSDNPAPHQITEGEFTEVPVMLISQ